MRAPQLLIAAATATLTVAGCSSTVSGKGTAAGGSSGSGRHDFPSASTAPSPSASGSSNAPATSAPPASPTAPVHPVPTTPLATKTVHATGGTTYVVKIWADVKNTTCFDHAYGQAMVEFLTQHPCSGLERILATTTVKGRAVGIARSATSFTGTATDPYKWSGQFTKLEEQDGTGSINDLMREGYRLPEGPTKVPASEAFNVVGQDNVVTVWDAWYLDGPTPSNAKALIDMTKDLYLQF